MSLSAVTKATLLNLLVAIAFRQDVGGLIHAKSGASSLVSIQANAAATRHSLEQDAHELFNESQEKRLQSRAISSSIMNCTDAGQEMQEGQNESNKSSGFTATNTAGMVLFFSKYVLGVCEDPARCKASQFPALIEHNTTGFNPESKIHILLSKDPEAFPQLLRCALLITDSDGDQLHLKIEQMTLPLVVKLESLNLNFFKAQLIERISTAYPKTSKLISNVTTGVTMALRQIMTKAVEPAIEQVFGAVKKADGAPKNGTWMVNGDIHMELHIPDLLISFSGLKQLPTEGEAAASAKVSHSEDFRLRVPGVGSVESVAPKMANMAKSLASFVGSAKAGLVDLLKGKLPRPTEASKIFDDFLQKNLLDAILTSANIWPLVYAKIAAKLQQKLLNPERGVVMRKVAYYLPTVARLADKVSMGTTTNCALGTRYLQTIEDATCAKMEDEQRKCQESIKLKAEMDGHIE